MAITLPTPRLLPMTIAVMVLLLVAKGATFAKEAGAAMGMTSQAAQPGVAQQGPAQPSPAQPGAGGMPDAAPVLPPKAAQSAEVNTKELQLLQDLRKRRDALDAREHSLDERNSVLEAAELRLQSKIDQMAQLQVKLDALDSARKHREDADWNGLVKVYEDMKPRDAATIFDVLDMRVLLQVIDRMNERKAAAVLAAMQPERARMTTQMLAQMRLRQDIVPGSALPDTQEVSR